MVDISLYDGTNANGGLPIDLTDRSRRDNTVADPLAVGASTSAPAGPPISSGLKELCRNFNSDLMQMRGKRAALKGDTLRGSIQKSLDKSPGNAKVKCQSLMQRQSSICSELETHRGPVIVLAPTGHPQFIFEWKNDEWHGYNAVTFDHLPDGMSPAKKVEELFLSSHHSMYFSTYRVEGWNGAASDSSSTGDLLMAQRDEHRSEDRSSLAHVRRLSRQSADGDSSSELDFESSETGSVDGGVSPSGEYQVSEQGVENDHEA